MATTALALGNGIGKLFQAAAMGDSTRQKAYEDALSQQAMIGQRNSQIRLHDAQTGLATANAGIAQNQLASQTPDSILQAVMGMQGMTDQSARPAIAERLATGQWGGNYAPVAPVDNVGPMMPPPVNDVGLANIARAMGVAQRAQASKSNVLQESGAGLNLQRQQQGEGVMNGTMDPALVQTAQAVMAGRPYVTPVSGNSGQTIGPGGVPGPVNDVLARIFGANAGSKLGLDSARVGAANAAAGASGASAGASNARAERTRGGFSDMVNLQNDAGEAIVSRTPTRGAPVAIGTKAATGTGADATKAKADAALVTRVLREQGPGAAKTDVDAEISRQRSFYKGKPGAAPGAAPAAAPKIDMGAAEKIKARFRAGEMSKTEAKAALQKLGMD